MADEAAVRELVAREDDALGVVIRDGEPRLLAFGDEEPAIVELGQAAVALLGSSTELSVERYAGPASVVEGWKRAALSCLVLIGMLAGVMVVAFSLMEDKLTQTSAALEISPLSQSEYLLGKSLIGGALATAVTLLCFLVAGVSPAWAQVVVTALVASVPAVGLGLILGISATSDIQLLSMIKAVGIILPAPILAMLVPPSWHPTLWWVPTFWVGRGYSAALEGGGWDVVLLSAAVTLMFGAALLAAGRTLVARSLRSSLG